MAEEDILLKPVKKPSRSFSSSTADTAVLDDGVSSSINPAFSQDSFRTIQSGEIRGEVKTLNNVRVNSSYIPHNSLSRYGNAFSSLIPIRRVTTSKTEIPIDSVGLFTNATFSWVRQYRITKTMLEKKNNLPFSTDVANEKFLLPKSTYADSCEVNGRR